jgi:hypothetical protein
MLRAYVLLYEGMFCFMEGWFVLGCCAFLLGAFHVAFRIWLYDFVEGIMTSVQLGFTDKP